METSCLPFQLVSELRSVCWSVVSPPSVATPRGKYMRGNGRWLRSRPGSVFCGSNRICCFHAVLPGHYGVGVKLAFWLLQSLVFCLFFFFPSSCTFVFTYVFT